MEDPVALATTMLDVALVAADVRAVSLAAIAKPCVRPLLDFVLAIGPDQVQALLQKCLRDGILTARFYNWLAD